MDSGLLPVLTSIALVLATFKFLAACQHRREKEARWNDVMASVEPLTCTLLVIAKVVVLAASFRQNEKFDTIALSAAARVLAIYQWWVSN
ncbi:uncharacterized protein LY89DRAFT_734189 [Mollisia scopiformis]|uniref:Uncharacterized protein n=1 Tax=Mollisia scopiformis TaxID=149040 RepID=A0A194XBS5_MOLSC|nr:uncharacterized protein LY89DRAFT_734189 [Mollisia scopiformis]KUJ17207.1 hypothetical protein LY89DRAFT_734189 [Mollisia scopiformis]